MNEMEVILRHAEFGVGGLSKSYVELQRCRLYVGGPQAIQFEVPGAFYLFLIFVIWSYRPNLCLEVGPLFVR